MNDRKRQEVLLDVRHLSIGFETYDTRLDKVLFQPIVDLNITLHCGEVLAIVGASGSGKSLLAHAILGILPVNAQTGGEMYYRGTLMTPQEKSRLRGGRIAFIPQSVAFLDPLMHVGEQVRGTAGKSVLEKQREAFAHFNLKTGTEALYPFQLSGGMARRVLLSTARVVDAELFIADEPTPGLDLEIALEALKDFRELADSGKGVILITHDIDLALRVADKISIFHDGTVIETADVNLFCGDGSKLAHPYSRELFKALPQNEFCVDRCPKCGSSKATWNVDAKGMWCGCGDA